MTEACCEFAKANHFNWEKQMSKLSRLEGERVTLEIGTELLADVNEINRNLISAAKRYVELYDSVESLFYHCFPGKFDVPPLYRYDKLWRKSRRANHRRQN